MFTTQRKLACIIFSLGLALGACGEDDPSNGKVDAGTNLDSGSNNTSTSANNTTTSPNNTTVNNTNTGTDAGEMDAGPSDAGDEDAGVDSGTDMGMADAATDAAGDASMGADAEADMAMATYDTCEGAIDVTAGGSFTGSTATANSDYGPGFSNGCPAGLRASFADVVYSVTPTTETTYDFTVTPAATSMMWDPALYILTDCATDMCEDGTRLAGPGQPESITGFVASANVTYFIIVDSMTFRDGDFTFDVAVNP